MRLIREYRASLKKVNQARLIAKEDWDKKQLGSCADSLSFSIEYMEKGRMPGNRRAITRRSGTQRETPVSPDNINFIKAVVLQRKTLDTLTDQQKELLDDLLAILTKNEKEAFTLVRGSGYSFSEAAELMGVAKGTIQTWICRAENKFQSVTHKGTRDEVIIDKPLQRIMIF